MGNTKGSTRYEKQPKGQYRAEVRRLSPVDFISTKDPSQEVGGLFEFSQDMLAILTTEAHFYRANKAWERILGYAHRDLEKLSIFDMIHPDDAMTAVERFDRVISRQETLAFTGRCRTKDGGLCWVRWALTPAPGRPQVYASACDITDSVASNEDLSRTNEILTAVLLSAPIATWVTDLEGRIQFWNEAASDTLGWTAEDFLAGGPSSLPGYEGAINNPNCKLSAVDTMWKRKDGSVRHLRIWKAPLNDIAGEQVAMLGMSADITPLPEQTPRQNMT